LLVGKLPVKGSDGNESLKEGSIVFLPLGWFCQ